MLEKYASHTSKQNKVMTRNKKSTTKDRHMLLLIKRQHRVQQNILLLEHRHVEWLRLVFVDVEQKYCMIDRRG